MSPIQLYDLVLDVNEEIWSPNTAKARIALNIKGLPYDTKWLTFFDIHSTIPEVTKSNKRPTVPVIRDEENEKTVQDSWEIVKYLDLAYPNTPSLLHGDNEGLHFFFYQYCNIQIIFPVFKLCVLTIHKKCTPQPIQDWFRENREAGFKMSLEDLAGDENQHIAAIKSALGIIHTTLKSYPYLSGAKVGFADVALASAFVMLAALRGDIFEKTLLDAYDDDVIRKWWNNMEKYTKHCPPSEARL